MIKSETIGNLTAALISAQQEFPPVIKTKDNPYFKSKYADLAGCIEATQPILRKHGLLVIQFPVSTESRVGVLTLLLHSSGEFISQEYTLPMVKQDASTGVAAITFARRAAYMGVLGIAAEDDDGNEASGHDVRNAPHVAKINQDTRKKKPTIPTNGNSGAPLTSPELSPSSPQPPYAERAASLPTEDELNTYRARVQEIQKKLQEAGIKPSLNMSVGRKILTYILSQTFSENINEITVGQWEVELKAMEDMSPELLIRGINRAVKEQVKKETEKEAPQAQEETN